MDACIYCTKTESRIHERSIWRQMKAVLQSISMRRVSVVIPCYNEAPTIAELLRRVREADFGTWEKEVIVVDDGSQDGTRDILAKYRGQAPFNIILQEQNGGKGVAEKAGIMAATGDCIALQDADLEYDPQEIRKLLAVVEETDAPIVFGARTLGDGYARDGRRLIGLGVRVSTWWLNLLYGTNLTDAWTCYKLFSRQVAQKARFIGDGFEADYLFIGEAAAKGFPIVEVPISFSPRTVAEGKKIRYKDGLHSMLLLFLHWLRHARVARYVIAGGGATALNLFLLYLGTAILGWWYLAASGISFAIANIASFLLQKFWTFGNRSIRDAPLQFISYILLSLINIGINLCLMYTFVEWLRIPYLLAQMLSAGLIALESFFAYRAFIFRRA